MASTYFFSITHLYKFQNVTVRPQISWLSPHATTSCTCVVRVIFCAMKLTYTKVASNMKVIRKSLCLVEIHMTLM